MPSTLLTMSKDRPLMNFEEFRASEPMAEVVRQQHEHFRDERAAEALLRPGALAVRGWPEWPALAPSKVTA
jgi:hypothetical protein